MQEQDRQDRIAKFHSMVDNFLATVHEYDPFVGWQSPSEADAKALASILDELLELKFERDVDGWLPVAWQLTDRAKHRRTHFVPLLRSKRDEDTCEWWKEQERRILQNVRYAIEEYESHLRQKEFYPFPKDKDDA